MDEVNNIPTNFFDAYATIDHLQQPFTSPVLNISSDHQAISLTKCTSQESQSFLYHQNPRKQRSKLVKVGKNNGVTSVGVFKPKISKKLDPNAPKITTPCSVCGKRFWSWKALFGHMRCHPERQWRGINPPSHQNSGGVSDQSKITKDEHAVAEYLLLLANGPTSDASDHSPTVTAAFTDLDSDSAGPSSCGQFQCSGHKKFLIGDINGNNDEVGFGHQCGICFRVFPSGQALGGHMRCHSEKGEGSSALISLNLPAAGDDSSPRSCLSALNLDLRLGL